MRHSLTDADRRKVAAALADLGEVIRAEYPEAPPQGVGFSLALEGVVAAALPGWKSR